MSLTYPRDMPVGGVISQSFEPRRNDYGTSVIGGRMTSVTAGSPLWAMSMTLRDGDEDEVAAWRAFFASLRGVQRAFLAGDLTRPYPKAYPDGFTGMVRAPGGAFDGTATSWSVNSDFDVPALSGLPAGFEVSIGDYVMWRWVTAGEKRRALARAIEPAVANAAGVASIVIEPPLPVLVPGNAIADFVEPKCVMKMVPEQSQIGELDALHSASGALVALQDLRP